MKLPKDIDLQCHCSTCELARAAPDLKSALMEIRFIANGSGNTRLMIAKIYDIATRASRLEYRASVGKSHD